MKSQFAKFNARQSYPLYANMITVELSIACTCAVPT